MYLRSEVTNLDLLPLDEDISRLEIRKSQDFRENDGRHAPILGVKINPALFVQAHTKYILAIVLIVTL